MDSTTAAGEPGYNVFTIGFRYDFRGEPAISRKQAVARSEMQATNLRQDTSFHVLAVFCCVLLFRQMRFAL